MFEGARADAEKAALRPVMGDNPDDTGLSKAQQDALRRYQAAHPVSPKPPSPSITLIPQACALLLSTGQIVGGVASNPITYDNPEAENAVMIAHSVLKSAHGLKEDFQIVAVALTTTKDQPAPEEILDLFEQSLSELPNLQALSMLLVDPTTNDTAHSAPFSDYRIV